MVPDLARSYHDDLVLLKISDTRRHFAFVALARDWHATPEKPRFFMARFGSN
jgi:hypothetical protein